MLAGLIYLSSIRPPRRFLWALVSASLLALISTIVWQSDIGYRAIVWGAPAFGIVVSAVLYEKFHSNIRWPRVLLRLGDSSYSLYLTHGFLFMVLGSLLKRISLWPGFADALILLSPAFAVLIGGFAYRLLERPLTTTLHATINPWLKRRVEARAELDDKLAKVDGAVVG